MNSTTLTADSILTSFAETARFALEERRERYTAALTAFAAKCRRYSLPEVVQAETELRTLECTPGELNALEPRGLEVRRLRAAYERDICALLRHLPADVKAVALRENIVAGASSASVPQDRIAA